MARRGGGGRRPGEGGSRRGRGETTSIEVGLSGDAPRPVVDGDVQLTSSESFGGRLSGGAPRPVVDGDAGSTSFEGGPAGGVPRSVMDEGARSGGGAGGSRVLRADWLAARLRLMERCPDPVRGADPGDEKPRRAQVTPPNSAEFTGEVVSVVTAAGGRGSGGGGGSEAGPGWCCRMWVMEFLSARSWQTSAIPAGGAGST